MTNEQTVKLVAMAVYPGWGVSVNGQLIVGPVSYEEAEEEMIRLQKLTEVRS